ncbi:MAG: hypothetical protein AB1551_07150 [Actinomycetota bacterium]
MGKRKTFPLRISPGLYSVLERWASDELRSVNAQIEYLLVEATRRAGRDRPTSGGSEAGERREPYD